MSFIELHAASAFSFLDGASLPEDLAARAAELGLPALALLDKNGVYGAPRFYKAARQLGLKALVGAEVSLEDGGTLPVLVASRAGYRNLCRLLTAVHAKPEPFAAKDELARHADGLHAFSSEPALLSSLREIFSGRVHAELNRHRRPEQEKKNRVLIERARALGVPLLAANAPRYARPADKELFDALTCIRLGVTLEEAADRLAVNRERHLKGAADMAALFPDLPGAVAESVRLAERLDFTLENLGYRFPEFPLPSGATPDSHLRALAYAGAARRFPELTERVRAQLDKELALIAKLGLAGYFLIVWDIVEFCRREKILIQGRGSAANSAVCYALSITAVDPVKMDLLFERFLSEERGEWPDIDLDLPSGDRRERVIQYLYSKYGAPAAAMTANVITYRGRSAIRELAKVFGAPPEQADRLSKTVGGLMAEELRAEPGLLERSLLSAGVDPRAEKTRKILGLWTRMQNLPRHLSQHPGGMVLAHGRLDEIVPLEPATMPGRVVVQWDKDDCTDLGLIKVDLLGLGMMAALEEALPMIERHEGVAVDLARLPPDDAKVFAMLNAADTVGVFQLESRAQMASLPRNAPRRFYDLVIQVAIIRPGPIVGGMIRPFFERRKNPAAVRYPHPCLEPILKRTLGVPLFQEQVLRMAMAAAGFTGGEAEELRRAMGFKRSVERMDAIEARLRSGMEARGIGPAAREEIVRLITSFALYGFPESHAASFALIAYASAYLKAHHPAAFYASLLNAWPMGFYHPSTLVTDAARHGVVVHPIDVARSGWKCRWEAVQPTACGDGISSPIARSAGGVRLGLRFIKGLRESAGRAIEAGAPFADARDLARRAGLHEDELERLAQAGALSGFGLTRRAALWQAAQVARSGGPLFESAPLENASPLPEMSARERTAADYRTTEITTGPHFMAHLRRELDARGVLPLKALAALKHGSWVKTAGAVIVRQRPGTAKGFVFVTLEDETGLAQAIISPALFSANRLLVRAAGALIIEGALQNNEGTVSVKAGKLFPLQASAAPPSHDFH
jgi:error-prone DNA polymerase